MEERRKGAGRKGRLAGGTYVCLIGGLWEKEIGGGSRGGVMVDLSGRGNRGGGASSGFCRGWIYDGDSGG